MSKREKIEVVVLNMILIFGIFLIAGGIN